MRQRRGFAQRLLQPGPYAGGLSDRNQRALPPDRARKDRRRRDLREGAAVKDHAQSRPGRAGLALTLVIGNKNYSSWSFRPWIAMKVAGVAFDEVVISLDAPDFKSRVSRISSTGKVPALDDNGIHVWESLAILEYLAERFPAARLWPADPAARAQARAISSEMHAGFVPLR